MPIYKYKCTTCDQIVEQLKPISKRDEVPLCSPEICLLTEEEKLRTLENPPTFIRLIEIPSNPQFKGNGFYQTDYKNKT